MALAKLQYNPPVRDQPSVAWLNGRLVPWREAVLPIEDRGLQFAESIYEVFPVTAGMPRLVAEHYSRMRRCAEAIGIVAGLPSCAELADVARQLVGNEQLTEGLIYAQVTGGSAPRNHLARPRPNFFAYVRGYRFPRDAEVRKGLDAITLVDERWAGRDLKTTMLLPVVLAKRTAAARGAGEAILIGVDDEVHEGASSNLFVVQGGSLLHPAASRHLLAGTIAPLAVRYAAELGLTVQPVRLEMDALWQADECFCTATSRLAMPILTVDGRAIGDGTPGPVAVELARRLREHFELVEND